VREIRVGELGLYVLQGRLRLAQGPLRLLPRREFGAEAASAAAIRLTGAGPSGPCSREGLSTTTGTSPSLAKR